MALTDKLTAIGNAIREKNGTTDLIPLVDMPQAILDISGGGTELAVEYIESTGYQYIDTGYIANQNTKIQCKYQIIGANGEYDTLFSDFTNIQYSHRYEGKPKVQLVKWGGQSITFGSALTSSGVTVLSVDNGTFSFNENGVTTTRTIGKDSEFTSPHSILLFSNRYYKDVSQYEQASCCKARFYYFRIYDGDTLVRDFVPAVDENGVICLYDNVTKAYFYNQGEGEFIGGFVENELIEIETLIDESGVLEDTEGTATEKVEQLIENSKTHNLIQDGFDRVGFTGANASSNGIFASQIWAGSMPLFDYENVTTLYRLCYGNINITEIELKNTHNNKNAVQIFHNCANLSKVVGLDFTSVEDATNAFFNCSSLKDITFVAKTIKVDTSFAYSPLLTNESKQSIIDGLATVETAQTITFHKDVKILQAQVDSANAKGWTVAGGTVVSEEEYYG